MSNKLNTFRKGDIVRLVCSKNLDAPVGSLAIVTGTSAQFIIIEWLHRNSDRHKQCDGGYLHSNFTHVNPKARLAPFMIGDVVEAKTNDGDTGLCLVVMTDWHRNEKFLDVSNKTLLRSVMCDGYDSETWENYDERYTHNPSYIYVVPITHPGNEYFTGPIESNNVKLVMSTEELTGMINKHKDE